MPKLIREQKIEIYYKHKEGKSYNSLVSEYGIDILRNGKNKVYSKELKLEMINKVLIDNQSIHATIIKYG